MTEVLKSVENTEERNRENQLARSPVFISGEGI